MTGCASRISLYNENATSGAISSDKCKSNGGVRRHKLTSENGSYLRRMDNV